MAQRPKSVPVYLETGSKRTFACAVDWPGWCRSGSNEELALQALLNYASRYALVPEIAGVEFAAPDTLSQLSITERLKGNATTDFGAPGQAPTIDSGPVDESELERLLKLLKACWSVFEKAVNEARGKQLSLGPRGGGRDLEEIIRHIRDAEEAYLGRLGWKRDIVVPSGSGEASGQMHDSILKALTAAAAGDMPEKGPKGGIRWTPRYFVRREAWHVIDHAWEIEDRIK